MNLIAYEDYLILENFEEDLVKDKSLKDKIIDHIKKHKKKYITTASIIGISLVSYLIYKNLKTKDPKTLTNKEKIKIEDIENNIKDGYEKDDKKRHKIIDDLIKNDPEVNKIQKEIDIAYAPKKNSNGKTQKEIWDDYSKVMDDISKDIDNKKEIDSQKTKLANDLLTQIGGGKDSDKDETYRASLWDSLKKRNNEIIAEYYNKRKK